MDTPVRLLSGDLGDSPMQKPPLGLGGRELERAAVRLRSVAI
jgi:hypothetical protein